MTFKEGIIGILDQGSSTVELMTFGAGESFIRGGVLCIAVCLAAHPTAGMTQSFSRHHHMSVVGGGRWKYCLVEDHRSRSVWHILGDVSVPAKS